MSSEDFAQIEDVNEGLENRIYNAVRQSTSVEDIYKLIKQKIHPFTNQAYHFKSIFRNNKRIFL